MNSKDQRTRSGSVLVYVLVLLVIAGLIAASYLAFVDNQRQITARNLNQDGLRISTEQALLSLESAIRSELLATGEVKLASLNRSETVSGISLSLSSKTDGAGSEVLQVQPFANSTEVVQLPPLAGQDLFGQAHARVTLIDVDNYGAAYRS
jgi:Tfp pilus assembly protein PilX